MQLIEEDEVEKEKEDDLTGIVVKNKKKPAAKPKAKSGKKQEQQQLDCVGQQIVGQYFFCTDVLYVILFQQIRLYIC